MTTLNDLRRVADEMENWFGTTPSAGQMTRWANTIREFTETPRCPKCGTNVEPKTHWMPEDGPSVICKCVACLHDSGLHHNDRDALAAFYGEGE